MSLAVGQLDRQAVGAPGEPQVIQGVGDGRLGANGTAARPGQIGGQSGKSLRPHGHGQVLCHAQIVEQFQRLEGTSQPKARTTVWGQSADVGAVELHGAPCGTGVSRHGIDEGGLAGAVGADEAHHLARLHHHVHPVESHQPTVANGQPGNVQQRRPAARGHAATSPARCCPVLLRCCPALAQRSPALAPHPGQPGRCHDGHHDEPNTGEGEHIIAGVAAAPRVEHRGHHPGLGQGGRQQRSPQARHPSQVRQCNGNQCTHDHERRGRQRRGGQRQQHPAQTGQKRRQGEGGQLGAGHIDSRAAAARSLARTASHRTPVPPRRRLATTA